jgi:fumarate reductase flavoprotein subunit
MESFLPEHHPLSIQYWTVHGSADKMKPAGKVTPFLLILPWMRLICNPKAEAWNKAKKGRTAKRIQTDLKRSIGGTNMSKQVKDVNLVVIGAGGAGLAAAVTAMQNGLDKILVLEKSPFTGGNSRMAGGHMVCVTTEDKTGTVGTAEETFREVIRFHHYERVEPKILRKFLDNTRGTIDWLENMGIAYVDNGGGMRDGKYPFGNFKMATTHMKKLLLEAGNEVLMNTAATGIGRNADGKVCSVTAAAADGTELELHTRAVVIATGGFTGNSALLHKYFPDQYDDNYYTDALPQDGDGIALAQSAGAALTDYCTLVKENAYSCNSRLDAPNRAAHQACSLWINSHGERFHDESDTFSNESTNSLTRQPGKIGYALFDENVISTLEQMLKDAIADGSFDPQKPISFDDMQNNLINVFDAMRLRTSLEGEWKRKEGWVFKADTPQELAKQIGVKESALMQTLKEYNEDCVRGHDRLFGKPAPALIPLNKGPYYALKFRPIMIDTIGPIVINDNMEVLDDTHEVIPGLYAAGVITSGSQGRDYTLHGGCLSYSLFSGRFAGQSIVNYLNN